ncbi:glutathione S-transferase [Sphingomonas naasensis]|uniref:Glutathione S-transferase family protein n=2 Tax=Sphingomonas naasensis TaxID=1344951 RepID=A0A4V3QW09_9SPHN|nr:glutathione S-transferase family protein [Sphingomonas naasensis]NIJ22315.1 glutathione S-transferase [Sphingomonas naasensis]TGX40682.1 glutathione S-transferase family protein [Sphingomonas naasensis]
MLELFLHPFSSYSWKVLIPLYENGTAFTYRMIEQPENGAELHRLWPVGKFPLLLDQGKPIYESSTIIEHLQRHHPGPVRLIPEDDAGIEVRMLDRIFDNHVMAQMQRVVNDALRPPERRDPVEVEQAKAALDKIYGWLDDWLAGRQWAAADSFSLADCAAAPSLFYADWVHEIPETLTHLRAYRARLLARPSVARAVDEARPYRHYFPPGAPDRD